MAKFVFSDAFNRALSEIEDYIFASTGSVDLVSRFLDELDRVLGFVSHNPNTPSPHPVTGDQSWVMGDGRYRIFFKVVHKPGEGAMIFLAHIVDNKQVNLEVYPNNTLPTYEED